MEKTQYGFDTIMKRLRMKLVVAYLMVGDAKTAYEKAGEFWWRFAIRLLPGGIWKSLLAGVRMLKHRLLLKKL